MTFFLGESEYMEISETTKMGTVTKVKEEQTQLKVSLG